MVLKFYMPGEEGASLEQLAYGMVEKIARQTTETNYQFRAGQNLDKIIQQLKG